MRLLRRVPKPENSIYLQDQGVDPRHQGNGARGNGLVGVGPSAEETELQSLRDALKAVKEGNFRFVCL